MLDRLTIERAHALAGEGPLIVALSGGGDSTALLHLLVASAGARKLHAAVVDHALRPGSADDAEKARAMAERLGVAAEVATLSWPQGVRKAQQAARHERYRALCALARRRGASVIALGHTLDDQAETVFMRAAAGSTWRGLAGMAPVAPVPLWPEGRRLWLARPLLPVRRAALREFLRARGGLWIEDPANANPEYERVRARSRLSELERRGFDPERLARLAGMLRPRVERLDRDAAALIARAARIDGGRVLLERRSWTGGAEVRRRALSVLITAASGSARGPGWREAEDLEARLASSDFRGGALGGAVLRPRGDCIVIERDPGALSGRRGGPGPMAPLELPIEQAVVWDGRLEAFTRTPGVRIVATPSGPVLEQGAKRWPLSESRGVAETRWLLSERVRTVLEPA